MTKERLISLIDEMKKTPGLKDKLSDKEVTRELLISEACSYAKSHGEELTETMFYDLMADIEKEKKENTDKQSEKIQSLSDDDMKMVAGGTDEKCTSTYEDKENCFSNDACDKNTNLYHFYLCEHNDKGFHCGSANAAECQSFFI